MVSDNGISTVLEALSARDMDSPSDTVLVPLLEALSDNATDSESEMLISEKFLGCLRIVKIDDHNYSGL